MSTWLVVEDEPDIYEVLLAMFEVWGIEGVAFVDGSEAFAWIDDVDAGRVTADLPELAILDIRLPEASGPEVAARLRQSPVLKNMAIALITAYRLQPGEEEEVMEQSQADLLLYKPLPRPDEFRQLLEDALEKRATIAAAEADTEQEAGIVDEGEAEEAYFDEMVLPPSEAAVDVLPPDLPPDPPSDKRPPNP